MLSVVGPEVDVRLGFESAVPCFSDGSDGRTDLGCDGVVTVVEPRLHRPVAVGRDILLVAIAVAPCLEKNGDRTGCADAEDKVAHRIGHQSLSLKGWKGWDFALLLKHDKVPGHVEQQVGEASVCGSLFEPSARSRVLDDQRREGIAIGPEHAPDQGWQLVLIREAVPDEQHPEGATRTTGLTQVPSDRRTERIRDNTEVEERPEYEQRCDERGGNANQCPKQATNRHGRNAGGKWRRMPICGVAELSFEPRQVPDGSSQPIENAFGSEPQTISSAPSRVTWPFRERATAVDGGGSSDQSPDAAEASRCGRISRPRPRPPGEARIVRNHLHRCTRLRRSLRGSAGSYAARVMNESRLCTRF